MDGAEIIKRVTELLEENRSLKAQLEKVWAHVEALETLEAIEAILEIESPLMMDAEEQGERLPLLEEDDWHETKAGAGVADRWRLNGEKRVSE